MERRHFLAASTGLLVVASPLSQALALDCKPEGSFNSPEFDWMCSSKDFSRYPPGVAISSRAVQRAWDNWARWFKQDKKWRKGNMKELGDVKTYLSFSSKTFSDHLRTSNVEKRNNPMVYVLIAFLGDNPHTTSMVVFSPHMATNPHYGNLVESDPMVMFAEGMSGYAKFYIKGVKINNSNRERIEDEMRRQVEIPFLNALFSCAFDSLGISIQERYLHETTTNEDRVNLLDRALTEILSDSNSDRNRLIAAYASTWLTNHYWESERRNVEFFVPLKKMMNDGVEVKLRNVVPRVRATKGQVMYLKSYL